MYPKGTNKEQKLIKLKIGEKKKSFFFFLCKIYKLLTRLIRREQEKRHKSPISGGKILGLSQHILQPLKA